MNDMLWLLCGNVRRLWQEWRTRRAYDYVGSDLIERLSKL